MDSPTIETRVNALTRDAHRYWVATGDLGGAEVMMDQAPELGEPARVAIDNSDHLAIDYIRRELDARARNLNRALPKCEYAARYSRIFFRCNLDKGHPERHIDGYGTLHHEDKWEWRVEIAKENELIHLKNQVMESMNA